MKKRLGIQFQKPISGNDLRSINSLFNNFSMGKFGKKYDLCLYGVKMEDVLYKTAVSKNRVPKEVEEFLKGIIYGYTRIEPIFYYVDEWEEII